MQKIVRRIAVIVGSVAVSAGLMAVAAPAHADGSGASTTSVARVANDSSWGRP